MDLPDYFNSPIRFSSSLDDRNCQPSPTSPTWLNLSPITAPKVQFQHHNTYNELQGDRSISPKVFESSPGYRKSSLAMGMFTEELGQLQPRSSLFGEAEEQPVIGTGHESPQANALAPEVKVKGKRSKLRTGGLRLQACQRKSEENSGASSPASLLGKRCTTSLLDGDDDQSPAKFPRTSLSASPGGADQLGNSLVGDTVEMKDDYLPLDQTLNPTVSMHEGFQEEEGVDWCDVLLETTNYYETPATADGGAAQHQIFGSDWDITHGSGDMTDFEMTGVVDGTGQCGLDAAYVGEPISSNMAEEEHRNALQRRLTFGSTHNGTEEASAAFTADPSLNRQPGAPSLLGTIVNFGEEPRHSDQIAARLSNSTTYAETQEEMHLDKGAVGPLEAAFDLTDEDDLMGQAASVLDGCSPEELLLLAAPPVDHKLEQEVKKDRRPSKKSCKGRESEGKTKKCSCKKSGCLKLYCECFSHGGYCDDSCGCVNCHNRPEFKSRVFDAKADILAKNSDAFKDKITEKADGPQQARPAHRKGCHCVKSQCMKNYCECYQLGVFCTDSCVCQNCHNHPGMPCRAEEIDLKPARIDRKPSKVPSRPALPPPVRAIAPAPAPMHIPPRGPAPPPVHLRLPAPAPAAPLQHGPASTPAPAPILPKPEPMTENLPLCRFLVPATARATIATPSLPTDTKKPSFSAPAIKEEDAPASSITILVKSPNRKRISPSRPPRLSRPNSPDGSRGPVRALDLGAATLTTPSNAGMLTPQPSSAATEGSPGLSGSRSLSRSSGPLLGRYRKFTLQSLPSAAAHFQRKLLIPPEE